MSPPVFSDRSIGRKFRMHVWKHNGLRGGIAMAMRCVKKVERSKSASQAARAICNKLWHDLDYLLKLLNERDDSEFDQWRT